MSSEGYLAPGTDIDGIPARRGDVYRRRFYDILKDNSCHCNDGMWDCGCDSKDCADCRPCTGPSGSATMRFSKRPNFGKGPRRNREYVMYGLKLSDWEPL